MFIAMNMLGGFDTLRSNWNENGRVPVWTCVALAVLLVLLIVSIVVNLVHVHRKRARTGRKFFDAKARSLGLGDNEADLILKIAEEVGLEDLSAVLIEEDIFYHSVAEFLDEENIAEASELVRLETFPFLQRMQIKLGFGKKLFSTVQMKAEQVIVLDFLDEQKSIQVEIKGISPSGVILDADKVESLNLPLSCMANLMCEGGFMWEFDTTLFMGGNGDCILKHSNRLRLVNRRVFPRIPVKCTAWVAPFSFKNPEIEGGQLEFVRSQLIEIGGPGVKLKIPANLELNMHENILVVLELHSTSIGGFGKVRRVQRIGNAFSKVGVELDCLSDSEISLLITQTNSAARELEERLLDESN